MRWRSAVAVLGAVAASIACASCMSRTASSQPRPTQTHLTAPQAGQLIVQCFVDHHLIPAEALADGKNANPPFDSSTWLRDGKVILNHAFGAWFAAGNQYVVVVRGKSIADWMTAIEITRTNWPTSICGPMPG